MKTDSNGKQCVFCPENLMVDIIDENDVAYLTQVVQNGMRQLGRYFITPKHHYESVMDLPAEWTWYQNELLRRAFSVAYMDDELLELMGDRPLGEALNLSWNEGEFAGRRIEHIHQWVVFRYDQLKIGLDGLIAQNQVLDSKLRDTSHEKEQLRQELTTLRQRFSVQLNG